jgi:peptidoglycan hydrolase FlgJ
MDSLLSSVLSSTGLGSPSASGSKNDPEKIRQAASQFEALLIGQVLKTVHEDGDEGWLGSEDQTAGPAMGMADEYFAQAIAKRGGFGLAKMISSKLQPAENPPE